VSRIIVTCRSACYQSIACFCLLHRGHGPYTRRTDAAKQRTVAYLSGMGQRQQMFLLPALMTIVMPLHRPGSANVAASVCLYRERERALRFWLIVRPYPTAGLGYPILPGQQSRPLVACHICIMTGVLWRRRPSCCTPFCVPVLPRRRLVVQRRLTWGRGHGDAPARRPGADRPFRIPGHAPSVGPSPGRFATFWVRHCPLCRSINGVLASAGNSVGSRPAIPPLRTYRRSNSNHAGKRYVLGRNRESQIATCEVANA